MKHLFDSVSNECSELVTKKYSTSFAFGIRLLDKKIHGPIYAIYGFVRCADEIVDSFHGFDKHALLAKFRADTEEAIRTRISLNPILNSFQKVVSDYSIEWELVDTFLKSMEMDLEKKDHDQESYKAYIIGSAEVVGLMCLRVFTSGEARLYDQLKPYATSLGSAFQKVNFLRDAKDDVEMLGRVYFPGINIRSMGDEEKKEIEADIANDFKQALIGIKQLPHNSRLGVYIAYFFYQRLFSKIKRIPPQHFLKERIRIPNFQKLGLMFHCMIRHQLNLL